jgi:hypothetical protein
MPHAGIRRCWQRRPYRLVFRLQDRLFAVRGYDTLISEAVGVPVSCDDVDRFHP